MLLEIDHGSKADSIVQFFYECEDSQNFDRLIKCT